MFTSVLNLSSLKMGREMQPFPPNSHSLSVAICRLCQPHEKVCAVPGSS